MVQERSVWLTNSVRLVGRRCVECWCVCARVCTTAPERCLGVCGPFCLSCEGACIAACIETKCVTCCVCVGGGLVVSVPIGLAAVASCGVAACVCRALGREEKTQEERRRLSEEQLTSCGRGGPVWMLTGIERGELRVCLCLCLSACVDSLC